MNAAVKRGDFTQLASNYHHRVGYSHQLLRSIAALLGKPLQTLKVADVGAGTGKLTEELLEIGLTVTAVEPNDAMRTEGMKHVTGHGVNWRKGSGEATQLPDAAFDWVLMGSSFHWVDLQKGLKEFHRILKPGGAFTAIWNPRDLERSELQTRIDKKFKEMIPTLNRVSSGGKGYAADWFTQLASTPHFKDVLFLETKMDVSMTKDRYMGIWESVNDVRAQCTPEQWTKAMQMIEKEIKNEKEIVVPYATRAWTVWRQGK